ncbi:MAG TPA: hypothetical protein VLF14_01180 [Candidatus Binatia bacterium]|nr:hypothetical protein [Candidatus Binatia bacterium]
MKRPYVAIAALIAAAALPPALGAAPWVAWARNSTLQLVGRCDSRSSRWEGHAIYSYCEISVLQIVSGTPDPGLVVRQRGGQVDGIVQRISHTTLMEPGGKYLLFLARDAAGVWSPTSKGVNRVVDSADIGETVGGEPLDEVIRQLGGAN